ncbi:MAG TPA: helix-turn-helix domain-containing protein [Solirubrobacteraceae bacterium]|nr:helix-turn-helix domain-containing protein [Solirubrobacteraceae bacterium]
MATAASPSRLRERRLECGLTQADLAARAGVSRQLVAAVEAGQNAPAVDAALGLARALATTVEDLFAGTSDVFVTALGKTLTEGAPLKVGRVGDRLVAAELADHGVAGAGWAKPDGTIRDGRLRLFGGANPRGLVLAGCDPALGVAEAMLEGLGPSSLLALSAATGTGLEALAREGIHAAVVHGPPGELPEPPIPVDRFHLARWQVGLGLGGRLRRRSLEALLAGKAPIAQRDPAAASQQALERAAARVGAARPRQGPVAGGHIDAARIAATMGCAAVTNEAAARAFGLHFLPLEEHVVQIWLAERWRDHPGVETLGNVLGAAAFTERVAQFGGYDLDGCGSPIGRG